MKPMPPATVIGIMLLAVLLFLANAAMAFDIPPPPPPMYQGLILPLFPNGKTIPFSGESGRGARTGAGARTAAPAKATLATAPSQVGVNSQQLAEAFPANHRAQMTKVYQQSFDLYRQLEAKLGIPANDVAGAVAAFVAGNYMAFRGVEVPDEDYRRLVGQMRAALGSNPGFASANAADKRKLYEQMAMLGTFMAVARQSFQQNPNPGAEKNFRDSARANLELALKVPADQVRIGTAGLSLR